MAILDLVREELRDFAGYSSARKEATRGEVWLNANESPWAPAGDAGDGLNRYPEPQPRALVERLAAMYGARVEQVLAGRGSDEAIDLLTRALCRAGRDAILVSPPTFGMYAVSARVQDAGVMEVPLGADFSLDPAAVIAAARAAPVKIVWVCSPNNPSGGAVPREAVLAIAGALAGRALVVVDEAYGEFAGDTGLVAELESRPNLALLRTLSKAHALAGARIGVLLADPGLVRVLRAIMAPYPLPSPSVQAALAATTPAALSETRERIRVLVAERERLRQSLAALPEVREVFASQANFLLVRFADAAVARRRAEAAGVVLRDFSARPGLDGCLRISIGLPAENERLLAALSSRRAA